MFGKKRILTDDVRTSQKLSDDCCCVP